MNTMSLLCWIKEREAIRLRREAGEPRPWTTNPILHYWSFCNVRREHDRVTMWIAKNWRDQHANDPDLFFAMAVARLVNWTESLAELGYPTRWSATQFVDVMENRIARGEKAWGDAYNISNGGSSESKARHVVGVLDRLWTRRARVRPEPGDGLLAFHGRLRRCNGFADFMSAQVVADCKYVEPLKSARDWMTFAASGPGSQRGLNRVLGRDTKKKWNEDDWRASVRKLQENIAPELARIGLADLHAQDLQNCLCEFDKYERFRLGEGKPKRKFASKSGGGSA